ncbi:MAG: DUF2284 domain-containing protein, partial [Bacillota bacterium]
MDDALFTKICEAAAEADLHEIAPYEIGELEFEGWVRDFCGTCPQRNRTWACPPAVGTLDECRERCLSYSNMLLFDRVYPITSSFDSEGIQNAMNHFKDTVDRFSELVKPLVGRCMFLANEGCSRCGECTWPDAPCRFPDMLYHTIEGYGFNIA